MAHTSSQPVKEIPGFARVGHAVRKGVLAALNPIFGTPENPTKLGRFMNLVDAASQYGMMAGPATGMVRYAVRAPLTVDPRFLGTGTVTLPNVQRSVAKAFVPKSGFSSAMADARAVREGLSDAKRVLVPKSMFSDAPGDFAYLDDVGNVVIPDTTSKLIQRYKDRHVRIVPVGSKSARTVPITEVEQMARNVDKASAPYDIKQANLRTLSDAVNPYWHYWMYERDIASLNRTLSKYRAPVDPKTGSPVFYKNKENLSFDVLSSDAAHTMLSNLPGTRYRLYSPGLGAVEYSPNHVSAMSRDRFVEPGSPLFDLYNGGHLPYQTISYLGTQRVVNGRPVRPVLKVTDHHELLDAPKGFSLSRVDNRDFPRVYHVGREVPDYKFTPVDPGDIEAVYKLDDQYVIPKTGRYTASIGVQLSDKGGDSPHKNFRNFLASDKVPDSIFGYRVVQREEDYTPEDIEFFKKNPKAAGFYDLGDGVDEEIPQQGAWSAGKSAKDQAGAASTHQYREEQDPAILRMKSAQHNGLTGAPHLVSRSSTRYFADTNYRRGATWVTPADSEFGEVEYFLDVANGEGDRANRVVVRTPTGVTPDWARRFARYLFRHHERGDKRFGAITEDDIGREVWLHAAALADSNNLRERLSSGSLSALGGGGLDRFMRAATSDYLRKHAEFTDITHADPKLGRLEAMYGKWEDQ